MKRYCQSRLLRVIVASKPEKPAYLRLKSSNPRKRGWDTIEGTIDHLSTPEYRCIIYFVRCRTSTSIIMTLLFNIPPLKDEHDPSVVAIIEHGERLGRATFPGAYLVEFFTWMKYVPKWFPGAGWKRSALQGYDKDTKEFMKLYKGVQEQVVCSFD